MKNKICFISSCGGHFMQMLKLLPVAEGKDFYIVTEKNPIAERILNTKQCTHYYLRQQERKNLFFIWTTILNSLLSVYYVIKERPNYVITTGAGAVFPTCIISKLFGAKIIYVESFARVYSASKTGKLVYRFADYFYVQWEEMLSVYPKAIYEGSIH